MALHKNTKFWASRVAVMMAVIACALMFLMYTPQTVNVVEGVSGSSPKESGIAASMSRFYSEFKQTSSNPIKERYGESTIVLAEQNDKPLGNVIENVSDKTYPVLDNWQGNYRERSFAAQSTLMLEAQAHAMREGFNLVWDLPQDFTVLNRYQSTQTLTGMLDEIAKAVDSNFNQPISIYFCTDKRAFVITVRESDYLRNNCEKTSV